MAVNTDMQNCPLYIWARLEPKLSFILCLSHQWSPSWHYLPWECIKMRSGTNKSLQTNCGIISARQQVFCGPHQINPSRRSDGTFSKINRCPMQQFVLQYIQPRYASRPQTWNLEAKLWWNPMRMSSIVCFHFVPLSQKCRNQAYIKAGLTDGWPPGCS